METAVNPDMQAYSRHHAATSPLHSFSLLDLILKGETRSYTASLRLMTVPK